MLKKDADTDPERQQIFDINTLRGEHKRELKALAHDHYAILKYLKGIRTELSLLANDM